MEPNLNLVPPETSAVTWMDNSPCAILIPGYTSQLQTAALTSAEESSVWWCENSIVQNLQFCLKVQVITVVCIVGRRQDNTLYQ